jgi:two-component system, OmpR family, alkaline phosphatase synthesis response regulator PhoP
MIIANTLNKSLKILVADDEKDIRKLISFVLQKHGYQVVEAVNGTQALQLAKDEKPDIVLLDLMMPQVNGFEVCRQLRSNPTTSKTPILMLSAKSQSSDIMDALLLGAAYYLVKPFTPRDLVEKVSELAQEVQTVG